MTDLLPAERGTRFLAGKAYHWARWHPLGLSDGPADLVLLPGHADSDPGGCKATVLTAPDPALPGLIRWFCVLHTGHVTRHLHRPDLGSPPVWWGTTNTDRILVPSGWGPGVRLPTEALRGPDD